MSGVVSAGTSGEIDTSFQLSDHEGLDRQQGTVRRRSSGSIIGNKLRNVVEWLFVKRRLEGKCKGKSSTDPGHVGGLVLCGRRSGES